jgi:hypothetical protein
MLATTSSPLRVVRTHPGVAVTECRPDVIVTEVLPQLRPSGIAG